MQTGLEHRNARINTLPGRVVHFILVWLILRPMRNVILPATYVKTLSFV